MHLAHNNPFLVEIISIGNLSNSNGSSQNYLPAGVLIPAQPTVHEHSDLNHAKCVSIGSQHRFRKELQVFIIIYYPAQG